MTAMQHPASRTRPLADPLCCLGLLLQLLHQPLLESLQLHLSSKSSSKQLHKSPTTTPSVPQFPQALLLSGHPAAHCVTQGQPRSSTPADGCRDAPQAAPGAAALPEVSDTTAAAAAGGAVPAWSHREHHSACAPVPVEGPARGGGPPAPAQGPCISGRQC